MKSLKRIVALVLSVLLVASCFAACSSKEGGDDASKAGDLKIGVITIGDETETYTKAHIDGVNLAAKEVGVSEENIIWKTNTPENEDSYNAAKELVASGCNLVISNSYGHQEYMADAAEEFPDVTFVAMTGDFAAISGLDNFYNAFTRIYEARYISGVVAGMKIKELQDSKKLTAENLDDKGNVKIGYVGAYPYAEVVSGYTAFYLGAKSVVENVVMDVQYTSSWFNPEGEAAAAEALMARGCVIIGQHADSTGAPTAVQDAFKNGKTAFSVGYNMDMTDVAPDVALTSPINNWDVYYKELFTAVKNGTEVPADKAYGYADNGVGITALGKAAAEGTQAKVDEAVQAIKDGSLKVFDTSKFTVEGKPVTDAEVDFSYMDFTTDPATVIYQGETKNCIVAADGLTFFDESTFRAAPYFSLRIDGITELNAK